MADRPRPGTITPLVIPEIVTLPAQIDLVNASGVGDDLRAACQPGVAVVIADMSGTTYCDSAGVRALLTARTAAAACGAKLRLVIPSTTVLRVLSLLGLDRLLQIYSSLGSALTAGPPPGGGDRQPA
jgi:anti-sigma B factor antagonist